MFLFRVIKRGPIEVVLCSVSNMPVSTFSALLNAAPLKFTAVTADWRAQYAFSALLNAAPLKFAYNEIFYQDAQPFPRY